MELYDAMSTLRAVRRLRPDPIPEEVLDRVFTAATSPALLRRGTSPTAAGGPGPAALLALAPQRGHGDPEAATPRMGRPPASCAPRRPLVGRELPSHRMPPR